MRDIKDQATRTRTSKHISPEPRVRVNPNTYKWRCPCCRKHNDDGDSTCIHCGQDVEVLEGGDA